MGEIVNLRRIRKEKARQEKAKEAEAARATHGRTKQEKTLSAAEKEKQARNLDAHKRDKD